MYWFYVFCDLRCCVFYNLNGAFLSIGVVPRDVDAELRSVRCDVGSTEPLRDGVCIPDGVDWPLSDFLQICCTISLGDSKMLACGKIGLEKYSFLLL